MEDIIDFARLNQTIQRPSAHARFNTAGCYGNINRLSPLFVQKRKRGFRSGCWAEELAS
jgi:hypothetical protein